jgi:hypothetical protein
MVFYKLDCTVFQRRPCSKFDKPSIVVFKKLFHAFKSYYLCMGSPSSVVVFKKLICAGTKRHRAGISQASLRSCSAPSVVVFRKLICAGLTAICGGFQKLVYAWVQRHLWWFFTS